MKIKICGLRGPEDVEYANLLMPDYIGFVFAKSKRQITVEEAVRMKAHLSPQIGAVGVFVNEESDLIIDMLLRGIIDVAQLHGNESKNTVQEIKDATGRPVWKAISVTSKQDIKSWIGTATDCLVLDNGQGTGKTFDWRLLREIECPYFLAGGIQADNIQEAIQTVNPYGIDVSSGAETNGRKDFEKMQYLIEQVRKTSINQ